LRGALTECAWAAAAKKNCFIKEKFWRLTTKHAGKKSPALVAVAHTILQLVYDVLRSGEPYRDRQLPALSEQQKERMICHHVRRLGKLGVRVYSNRPGPATEPEKKTPRAKRTREVIENK